MIQPNSTAPDLDSTTDGFADQLQHHRRSKDCEQARLRYQVAHSRLAMEDIPGYQGIRRYRIHRSFGFLLCPDEHPFQTEAVNHDSIII
jgi:hypothetical protein